MKYLNYWYRKFDEAVSHNVWIIDINNSIYWRSFKILQIRMSDITFDILYIDLKSNSW